MKRKKRRICLNWDTDLYTHSFLHQQAKTLNEWTYVLDVGHDTIRSRVNDGTLFTYPLEE